MVDRERRRTTEHKSGPLGRVDRPDGEVRATRSQNDAGVLSSGRQKIEATVDPVGGGATTQRQSDQGGWSCPARE
jgi:hypothetical protein